MACLTILIWGQARVAAAERPTPEYQVKASYLFHFLQFVEWPEASPDRPTDRWVLGVVGSDRFGTALDAIAAETVRGRPIEIRRLTSVTDAGNCHVLFVGEVPSSFERRLLENLVSRPVLTVGEDEAFLEQGGMIRFLLVGNRVRFRVHPRAAERQDMRLGAQLLELGSRR